MATKFMCTDYVRCDINGHEYGVSECGKILIVTFVMSMIDKICLIL